MSYITPPNGGSIEVFYWSDADAEFDSMYLPEDLEPTNRAGWYWQACFPGCLPDGDAIGPFDSEESAAADALEVFA